MQDRVVDVVEPPVERHPLAADERRDDLERLLEPPDAVVERVAEGRVLGLVPARAEAEDQAAVRDLVDRRRHLRGQRRRPEAGARGRSCPSSARSVAAATAASSDIASWMPVLVLVGEAEDQVVVEPQAVDAARLGEPRELA